MGIRKFLSYGGINRFRDKEYPNKHIVSKYGNRASASEMGRRLFLYLFTSFYLQFRYLLPVFQDSKYGVAFGEMGVRIYPK